MSKPKSHFQNRTHLSSLRSGVACLVATLALGLSFSQPAGAASNILTRYPTLHGDRVVFEAAGNLWWVNRQGGIAHRLTTDGGIDLMPRFSPDGKTIAFTGQYDGNVDVYTIPAEGGPVKRLTFHSDVVKEAELRWGPDNMVVTWTPDSKGIVFLSRRTTFNSWFGQLFSVPADGGLPTQLALPKGGLLSYNSDGTKIAYNRIFRNFRTWKQYYGGLAQDVWIYDFKTRQTERVTDWKGTDTAPMWYHDTIYFVSDRGSNHRLNLWAYDVGKKSFRQITHFEDYDVDWPSLGDNGITFQCGGTLYVLDLPSEELHALDVTVPSDGDRTRPRWADASKQIDSFDLAPNGKRAVFGARGDIFTVPEQYGNTRNLTESSDAREQEPAWSPDGKWVAYTTDRSGESQLAIRPANGGPETILTKREQGYLFGPAWSPDSKKLAYSDNDHTIWYVDMTDKIPIRVDQDRRQEIHHYAWSPDANWLAYVKFGANDLGNIYFYNLGEHQATRVSTGMQNDGDPVFSPDGKYLYFRSARHENPTFSESEFNVATLKMDGIYVATLRPDEPSPFGPRSDEGNSSPDQEDEGKPKPWKPGAISPIEIDLTGLMDRAVPLPIPSADISDLSAAGERLYFMTTPPESLDGPLPGEKPQLHVFDLQKRKDSVLVSPLDDYALSADGTKVLYNSEKNYYIIKALPGGSDDTPSTPDAKPLDLSEMQAEIDPVAEWHEMFHQAWRIERDFFYNQKMNGKDWKAIGAKYAKLLPEMGCREDLNYLIGEMIGELQNSHTYVGGGDVDETEKRVPTGLLGVDFALDKESGRYYFARIYPGDNSREDLRSPLTEPGVKAKKGDFLLAVDGHPLKAPTNPYSLFVNTLQRTVTLTLADTPAGEHRHDVTVKPIANELNLRLHAWIEHNRSVVDQASHGKIGYLYLSDMEARGMDQFIRQFYPQERKQGLIVDVRWNGGGFIDQLVLDRLRRVLVGMEVNRLGVPGPIPENVLHGYMACLINHYSASDGDIFPYFFKKYQLGPLIGTRTWGGVRGIRGDWRLLDGGYITVPEFSIFGLDSQWVLENHGVEPDIEVDDLPGDVMAGKDAQLNRAVEYILGKLDQNPMKLPENPPWLPAYPPKNHE